MQTMTQTKEKSFFYKEKAGTVKNEFYKIKISYQKGGINYFSGSGERRGVYVIFQTVERQDRDGYSMESFGMFAGFKIMALQLNRASARKFAAVCAAMAAVQDDLFTLYAADNRPALMDLITKTGAMIK